MLWWVSYAVELLHQVICELYVPPIGNLGFFNVHISVTWDWQLLTSAPKKTLSLNFRHLKRVHVHTTWHKKAEESYDEHKIEEKCLSLYSWKQHETCQWHAIIYYYLWGITWDRILERQEYLEKDSN